MFDTHSSIFFIYGAALAALPHAETLGQAVVVNSCNSTVWYASVDHRTPYARPLSPGQSYIETFNIPILDPISGHPIGTSIKLSYNQTLAAGYITQFEYVNMANFSKIYYDVSNVDGNIGGPFGSDGLLLRGTSSECSIVFCLPNEIPCPDIYIKPDDDRWNDVVHGCESSNSLVLTLCPNPADYPRRPAIASSMTTSSFINTYTSTSAMQTPACSATRFTEDSDVSPGKCSSSSPCEGDITYFDTGRGTCGITNDGNVEKIVALPHALMGPKSNGNAYCGKTITITCTSTRKTTTAIVADKCPSCEGNSIDLSIAAFKELADPSVGRTRATWYFI